MITKPTPHSCLLGLFCLFGAITALISAAAIGVRLAKYGLNDPLVREFSPFLIGGTITAIIFGYAAKHFYGNEP